MSKQVRAKKAFPSVWFHVRSQKSVYNEESLKGKTISKKNQALIKVRILNLREEKKNMRIELSMDLKMKEKIQN